ncbi:MAG: hypothetical protein R2850_13175 [Bacteroidia bacterium]
MNPKLNDLKKDVQGLPHPELVRLLMRMSRLKTENKELLHFMLYYEHDPMSYANALKEEVLAPFDDAFVHSRILSKKIRKSLKIIARFTRFSSNREGESDLLLSLVENYLETYRYEYRQLVLARMMVRCMKKVYDNFERIHEDFRADYSGRYNEALNLLRARLGTELTMELKKVD